MYLDGKIFEAQWYAKGDVPGNGKKNTPWSTYTACSVDPCALQAWANDTIYTKGDQVTYNGETYTAKWWTRGEAPGGKNSPWAK